MLSYTCLSQSSGLPLRLQESKYVPLSNRSLHIPDDLPVLLTDELHLYLQDNNDDTLKTVQPSTMHKLELFKKYCKNRRE